jgi:glycosyltransferase involved in cell wall biosynthesis
MCETSLRIEANTPGRRMLTVAIPTKNRARLLKQSLESIFDQSWRDFEVIVLDNASTDETPDVVQSAGAGLAQYVRHASPIPANENWNMAIAANKRKYLCIFHDDDIMSTEFLETSVRTLEAFPTTCFSFSRANCVDGSGGSLGTWYGGAIPEGLIKGVEYLHLTVERQRCISLAPTVVYRASMLASLGGFGSPHTGNTFDFNLFIRAAASYDVAFIDRELVHYRLHPGQMTERHWRSGRETGRVGAMAELVDAIGYLMTSERAGSVEYRQWLSERLQSINRRGSAMARTLIPDL